MAYDDVLYDAAQAEKARIRAMTETPTNDEMSRAKLLAEVAENIAKLNAAILAYYQWSERYDRGWSAEYRTQIDALKSTTKPQGGK